MNNLGYGRRKPPKLTPTCMYSVGLTTGEPYLLDKKWLNDCPLFYRETEGFAKYISLEKFYNSPSYLTLSFSRGSGVVLYENYIDNSEDFSFKVDLLDKSATTRKITYEELFGAYDRDNTTYRPRIHKGLYLYDSEKWLVVISHRFGSLNRIVESIVEVDKDGNAAVVGHYQDPEDYSKGTGTLYLPTLLSTGDQIGGQLQGFGDESLVSLLQLRVDWYKTENYSYYTPVDNLCDSSSYNALPYVPESIVRQKVKYYLEEGHLSPRWKELEFDDDILELREYPTTPDFIEYVTERVLSIVPDIFVDRFRQPIIANAPFTINTYTSCDRTSTSTISVTAAELLTPYQYPDYREVWLSHVIEQYPSLFEYSLPDSHEYGDIALRKDITLHTLTIDRPDKEKQQLLVRSDELVPSSKLDQLNLTYSLASVSTYDKVNDKYLSTTYTKDANLSKACTGKLVVCDRDGTNIRILEVLPYSEAEQYGGTNVAAAGGNALVSFVTGQTVKMMVVLDYLSDSYTVEPFENVGVYEGEPLPSGLFTETIGTILHNLPDSSKVVASFPVPSESTFQTFMNFTTDDCLTITRLDDEEVPVNYLQDVL